MLRQLRPALLSVLAFSVMTGFLFPLVVTGIARTAFPHQAAGSLILRDGKVIGSELIGQSFTEPGYFHPRPSAAGTGYDATSSGGSNLGPTNRKLIDRMAEDAAAYRAENGLPPNAELPSDAVSASASGLDPDISPGNAGLQVRRIAKARGLLEARVRTLVDSRLEGRDVGLFGEPRVNVLKVNLALDAIGRAEGNGADSGSR